MKFFLILLFLLLLFNSPQGSIISHKRSIRALNTTLETNFNGTYERRNPCTNAEIETTSYVASHEFRHHTEENNWSDYTNKCSSIISSFLQALGNLVHFNQKQNGIFNFHINTSISQKQVDRRKPGKGTSCDTLPTIIIEATDCELSPRLSCENLAREQLCQNQDEEEKNAICEDSFNKEIYRRNQIPSEKAARTPNLNETPATSTLQCRNKNEIVPNSSLDTTAAEDGTKLFEAKNAWAVGDIFMPEIETATSLEPEIPTASILMKTENSPQEIIDPLESSRTNFQTESYPDYFKPSVTFSSQIDPENFALSQGTEARTLSDPERLSIKPSRSFNELSPDHPQYLPQTPYFCHETTPLPIADEESFTSNKFSDVPFRKQKPTVYSKQLFDDNLDRELDSKFLPNQRPDDSIIFPDQIPKASFSLQEPVLIETYQPKNTAFEVLPVAIGQNERSFQQSVQSAKQPDNSDKIQTWPNTDIFSETTSHSSPNYSTKYQKTPFNQIADEKLPQVPNLRPSEKQFMDYNGQTSALEFSARYSKPFAQVHPNILINTFTNQNVNEAKKDQTQAIDYPHEFFQARPEFEGNISPITPNDNNDQSDAFSDDLSTSNNNKPLTELTPWISNERSLTEKSSYDVNDDQFLSTPPLENPSLSFTNESPFLISESQKSIPYYSEENSNESNTEKVTDTKLSLPSEQYQSVARPEEQQETSLLNSPDQYDNIEEDKNTPESNFFDPLVLPDSEVATDEPHLQSYSITPESQPNDFIPFEEKASSLQYPTGTTSNQKFSSPYDSTSDYESFSPSEGKTFSDEYLTTLPPEQDSSKISQKILTTLDPYQDQSSLRQTSFHSSVEKDFEPTFPGRMSPTSDTITLVTEPSSNDIYTPRTSAPISFDDYQDFLYSKPNVESSFTTPMQPFNEDTYKPAIEPNFTNDEKIYLDESQPTNPTVSGIDQLKHQLLPNYNQNSGLTLEQPLNFASDTSFPAQNSDETKSGPNQSFEKGEDSLLNAKSFSDREYNDFSTESFKTEGFTNYDSEVPPDSLVPHLKKYLDDNVSISSRPKKDQGLNSYFSEDFPQKTQMGFSPQPFTPYNNKKLFPNKSSSRNVETTSSSEFNTADDYFESIIPNNNQKVNLPERFSDDSDARPKQFFSELPTTPLPPFSLPFEDFSSSSNYKTILENPLTQNQAEESLPSLDQSVGRNFPPQFKEPPSAFSAPFRNVNKFDSDFQVEKQLSELETTREESTQSATPVYTTQNHQPFSYSAAAESLTPYDDIAADQPIIQKAFFPEQKSFPKPLTSDLSEYDSTASDYPLTDNYNINDSDNLESLPVVDQQARETTDRESILNSSDRFSDSYPKESSADFIPSAERTLIQKFDSPKEQTDFYLTNQQHDPDIFEPQSLISTTGNDHTRSLNFQSSFIPESQPESVPSFLDNKPLADFSEETPLDIQSQTDPFTLTKNEKLKSNDFQTPDSLASAPYIQPQKVPSYSTYHPEVFSKDSQSSSVEDFSAVVSPESHFTKPEIYRNIDRPFNPQTAAKFNAFQSQRRPKTYNQFPFAKPLQSAKYNDKKVIPNNDHSSTLKSTSQIHPSIYNNNKQVLSSYSGPDFAPKSQSYQPEPSLQALEEFSDITPSLEKEIPLDIERTTAPSTPEVNPMFVNEQSEYSSALASEQRLNPQSSYDKSLDISGGNMAEKQILSPLQTSNLENTPFFEVKSEKPVTRDFYPVYSGAFEQDAVDTDYNQPKSKNDYYDDSSNTNFDASTSDLSNPIQPLVASPTLDSVPNVQLSPNDLSSFPQSPVSTSYRLNNNLNEPSEQNSAIRYSQTEKEISFVTDNVSPQAQPTTAVYNDKEITEISPTAQPQPQTTLNFADQFSDDNIAEQLSDAPDRQYQTTPKTVPSEFQLVPSREQFVSTQRNSGNFDTSEKGASNQPPLLFQSQTQQLDVMKDSPDQNQNNFDSKIFSQGSNASPQSQHEPSIINPERLHNSHEQFSRYNPESQSIVTSNKGAVSTKYLRDPSIHSAVYDQFSSNVSPREQRYSSEALPYVETQGLDASLYGPQALDSKNNFQTQPYISRSSRYPVDVSPVNGDKNEFPSAVSRHSATQRFDSQSYPINFPNVYPNYNTRVRPNVPKSNFYNNEPTRQSNRDSSQYFTNDAAQGRNSFETPFPLDQHPKRFEVERSPPDQTIKNADSPSYDDYDQMLFSQLPNEKLLEYDEDITPESHVENSQKFQLDGARQQDGALIGEDPRESSDDFLTEADSPLGFSRKSNPYDFQDRSSLNNEPLPFMSPSGEKEPHSNPLLQTLESHLTSPFQEHLRPPASYSSFEDTEKESLSDSFEIDPQNQNNFGDSSAVPSYSEGRVPEIDFVNHKPSQTLNGVNTAQDVMNIQPDSHALVSDPNIPSNKPGEDCISCSGLNQTPFLCPFDPVLKGNMTAPSYYILISKLPADDDDEEQFKVEKVYLGDGMPLNCTFNSGETFPTSLCTPIPFSAAGTVKFRTKSDFA